MRETKKKRLEAAGWRVGSVADFLDLTPEEAAYVELKLALADYLRELRSKKRWTQAHVAKTLRSSQSRVAKMEAADPSVSVDLLVRSLLTFGATRKEVGRAIGSRAAGVPATKRSLRKGVVLGEGEVPRKAPPSSTRTSRNGSKSTIRRKPARSTKRR
jgi:transcriptional regulator with XRE-family HTH domain